MSLERNCSGSRSYDQQIVDELRSRARDVLLTQAIASEETADGAKPAEDLLSLDGMDDALARKLASRGIVTEEDLAEQAVDELADIDENRSAASHDGRPRHPVRRRAASEVGLGEVENPGSDRL